MSLDCSHDQNTTSFFQVNAIKEYVTPEKFWSSLHHIDYKFLIIPVVFVFLRIWSAILGILYDYMQLEVSQVPKSLNLALLYLSVRGYPQLTLMLALMISLIPRLHPAFQCCTRSLGTRLTHYLVYIQPTVLSVPLLVIQKTCGGMETRQVLFLY